MLGVTLPTYHVSPKLGDRMVGIVTPRNSVSKCPFDHTGFRALASTDRTPWTHVYYGLRGQKSCHAQQHSCAFMLLKPFPAIITKLGKLLARDFPNLIIILGSI